MRYSGQIITLRPEGIRVKQVNKAKARRLYDEGKTIYLNSCNMSLNIPWVDPFSMDKSNPNYDGYDFDYLVIVFENYNCDSERGKYANFFVEV